VSINGFKISYFDDMVAGNEDFESCNPLIDV
jgi:hypothetical protein